MRLTVAICTWNRAPLLARTLDGLTRVRPPAAPWELVVVDNGSMDDTAAVLDRFVDRLPLRVAREPRLGLSHARNAAVAVAAGEYILWTDDDVRVDEAWLVAYEAAVARWPEAAVFGGPIRPEFESPPPAWLLDVWADVSPAFATRDLGSEPLTFDGVGKMPFGANYVVRTREQRRVAYDPSLGRRGHGGRLGEETALVLALLREGATGWWVPDAIVNHWVPRRRARVSSMREYFALVGRTYGAAPRRRRERVALLGALWRAEWRYGFARLSGDARRWVPAMIEASLLRGRLQRDQA